MIFLSLIILFLSLSVVSAVDNEETNISDDVGMSLDNNNIISNDINIMNKEDSDSNKKIPVLTSDNNSGNNSAKALISAYYNDEKIHVTVVDVNNNPLSGVNVELSVHADYSRGPVKLEYIKTNSKGIVSFDVSDLTKPSNYCAHITVNDTKYDSEVVDVDFTVAKIFASYKNKKIYVTVVDANNNPLKNANVHLGMLASYTGHLVKIVNAKTNSKGDVSFDVSDLTKPATYFVSIGVWDDKYSPVMKSFEYTVSKKSKVQNSYHQITNNKYNKNNANPVNMRNTGIPVIGLLLVLFAILGVGYRKY